MHFDTNIEVLAGEEVNLVGWQDAAQGGTATQALKGLSETLRQQSSHNESFNGFGDGHCEVFDAAGRFEFARCRELQLEVSPWRTRFYKPSEHLFVAVIQAL